MTAAGKTFVCLAVLLLGSLFVTGCRDRGDTDSMTYEGLVHSFQADKVGVNVIELSPDETSFFTGGSEGVKQWDSKSFKLIRHGRFDFDGTGSANAVLALAADPDQPLLYMGLSGSKDVEIWNYQTNELVGSIPTRERWCEWVNALAISPDGSLLAIAENGGETKEQDPAECFSIMIWDLAKNCEVCRFFDFPRDVNSLKFSRDQTKLLARSGSPSSAIVWSMELQAVVGSLGDIAPLKTVWVIRLEPRPCILFRQRSGQAEGQPSLGTFEPDPLTASRNLRDLLVKTGFETSGVYVLGSHKGSVEIRDVATNSLQQELVQFTNGDAVNAVAATSDGTVVISGGDGLALGGVGVSVDQRFRQVCVWDVEIE